MQSSASLTISDLWIERGGNDLCKGLSFSIHPGEAWRVLGGNGTGKTSLLKVVAGISMPLEGEIFYSGQNVTSDRSPLQQEMVYLGHLMGVKSALTVEENLRWYCPERSLEELHNVAKDLGLFPFLASLVKTLSAGQQRRVALARLWLSKKTLWLLDEPFASLDVEGGVMLEACIQQHLTSGGLVLLSTHQHLSSIIPHDIVLQP